MQFPPIPSDRQRRKLVISGEEPFNMTMMTANAGGSLGKIAGNKPVIFTILSPEQPYAQMEAAQNYTIRFYPNGQTEPSVILECKESAVTSPDRRYAAYIHQRNPESKN